MRFGRIPMTVLRRLDQVRVAALARISARTPSAPAPSAPASASPAPRAQAACAPAPSATAGPGAGARLAAVRALLAIVALASSVALPGSAAAAGPPFPSPVPGQRVYDGAGVFDPATVARAEAIIAGIEQRTGAQVAVYTQRVDDGVTQSEAEDQARALMDQWGVGRKGFDDGLVILYDVDSTGCHGQVNLYAGAGFRSTFLSDAERQAIFDDQMRPYLADCRLGDALLVALDRVDASATPEHAASLDRARIVDAVLGLILAPVLFLLLVAWVVAAWLRHGRDPVYLDDPSIHIPAPPPGLTPATGTLVFDGRSSRRALTTALLDLASRGELSFQQEEAGFLVKHQKLSIAFGHPPSTDAADAHALAMARRGPTGPAESYALDELRRIASPSDRIEPDDLTKFASHVAEFDDRLETNAVANGWFAEKPTAASRRWYLRGGIEAAAGVAAIVIGFNIPFNGLLLVGAGILAAAIVTLGLAYSMPARTLPGAMIRAMLAAYRRTLEKTMAQARSMGQVVQEAGLPWLETPDQAVVWATALGLSHEVEAVLGRTLEDVRDGRVAPSAVYAPLWYVPAGSSGGGSAGWFGGGSQFSSTAIPSVGGMMAAIGTIGAPAGGGGGGGGGFGGGGGGGGGGAGGGF
jgi:uncharacterized membrane protein YgcG